MCKISIWDKITKYCSYYVCVTCGYLYIVTRQLLEVVRNQISYGNGKKGGTCKACVLTETRSKRIYRGGNFSFYWKENSDTNKAFCSGKFAVAV